jgi:AcrR family transcriptional regulator
MVSFVRIIWIVQHFFINGGLLTMKKTASKTRRKTLKADKDSASRSCTKDKLRRSAEALFSAKGFQEVSVREIAAHAGVNYALVAYYFRGKQTLFDEVFRAHTDPLLQEGMKRLQAIMRNGQKPSVEEILKAWLLPLLQLENNQQLSAIHLRVTANLSRERWEHTNKVSGDMRRSHIAFIKALHSCLPHLSKETLTWRLHFVMGALVFGIRQPASLIALSGGRCDPNNLEAVFDQILPYAVAGFSATETADHQRQKQRKTPAKKNYKRQHLPAGKGAIGSENEHSTRRTGGLRKPTR